MIRQLRDNGEYVEGEQLRKQKCEKREKNGKQRDKVPKYKSKNVLQKKIEICEGLIVLSRTHDYTTPLLSIRIKFLCSMFFYFYFSVVLSTQLG